MIEVDRKKMEKGITLFLEGLGVDLKNQHLQDTPARVTRAWADAFCSGYQKGPKQCLGKIFYVEHYDQMIIVKDIPFMSICAHHMIPFRGTAKIGYIPGQVTSQVVLSKKPIGQIIGLSKLARILDMFAQRLQVQEDLTSQVANTINEHLRPLGVGVVIEAEHLCMTQRGVQKPGSKTITSYLLGIMREDPKTRAEFLSF